VCGGSGGGVGGAAGAECVAAVNLAHIIIILHPANEMPEQTLRKVELRVCAALTLVDDRRGDGHAVGRDADLLVAFRAVVPFAHGVRDDIFRVLVPRPAGALARPREVVGE
jgi:hypothetical protein